ncbi:hypothetical protein R1flu_007118 [Riccia fluitans]|uniref:FYVE-type domain-containing protein n=1 Tax=Riccia fluitans TaxID=41844 RepID=A0ABD1YZ24_9MARC
MLEKIGLPAKPSAKGNTWVIDASSCQGCQGVFTMFNRKVIAMLPYFSNRIVSRHHCRRCGGIFCGNCTSQRAILRGQGDAPVRICDPCKKLEEAARFQLRNRGKKGAKVGSTAEDDTLLKDLLGDDVHALLSGRTESGGETIDDFHNNLTLADSSNSSSANVFRSEGGEDEHHEESRFTPEELRSQAIEQKNLYTSLKKEGKNAEALQAYKRSKELGREADAIELSLKKIQRKATLKASQKLKESSAGAKDQSHDGTSGGKDRNAPQDLKRMRLSSKDSGDDDLLKTLKELGWNEADLAEEKTKKGPTSDLELLAEISDVLPSGAKAKKPAKENPTQLEILAHKRKALALKREGKPAEAKEELKKAKLLEKELEEMALLGDEDDEDDEDDDELVKLMKSLEKEAKSDFGKRNTANEPINLSLPSFLVDDDDDQVDVTDDDVYDPSIAAALREMGWEEEAAAMERSHAPSTSGSEALHIAATVATESSLQSEILKYKREALALKREGKIAEAKSRLQEAKILEQKLETLRNQPPVPTIKVTENMKRSAKDSTQLRLEDILEDKDDSVVVDEEDEKDPEILAALKAMGSVEDEAALPQLTDLKPSPLERKKLQDEILAVKRSALSWKRSGRVAEAKEELRQAKVLEQRLEKLTAELEAEGLPKPITVGSKWGKPTQIPALPLSQAGFVSEDEEEEVEVSAEDFKDPDLVAALKSVGWQEEDTFVEDKQPEKVEEEPDSPPPPVQPYKPVQYSMKDRQRKLQLQKDLLSHKRKALTLKREGKAEEAKAELKLAKTLEKEMEELENAASGSAQPEPDGGLLQKSRHDTSSLPAPIAYEYERDAEVTDADMHDPEILEALKGVGWKAEPESVTADNLSRSSSSGLPALAGVDNIVSLKSVLDSRRMPEPTPKELDHFDSSRASSKKYENPPYTRNEPVVDTVSDPVWQSIVNSSSKKHDEYKYDEQPGQSTSSESITSGSVNLNAPFFDLLTADSNVAQKSSQPVTLDLLSGDTWSPPSKEINAESDSDDDDLFDADMVAALQSIGLAPPVIGTRKGPKPASAVGKQDASSGMTTRDETTSQVNDKGIKNVSSPVPISASKGDPVSSLATDPSGASDTRKEVATPKSSGTSDLTEEIKMRKRKAVGLKREGKLAEAREELRQAKLLEKQLETVTSAAVPDVEFKSTGSPTVLHDPSSPMPLDEIPSTVITTAPTLTHKQEMQQQVRQGKDRMKLQRESLAHKRKALALRREGKMEEAEAETELAKALEVQMEELDPSKPAHDEGAAGLVEDLMDPQLMAALKGIGWNEADLSGAAGVSTKATSSSSVSRTTQPSSAQVAPSRPAVSTSTMAQEGKTSTSHQPPPRKGPGISTSSNTAEEKSARLTQPPMRKAPVITTSSSSLEEKGTSINQPPARRPPSVSAASSDARTSASKVEEERKPVEIVGRLSAAKAQEDRKKLEDRIKQEKVRAVELKRAGRTREALDTLKGAKQMEKQLESMP